MCEEPPSQGPGVRLPGAADGPAPNLLSGVFGSGTAAGDGGGAQGSARPLDPHAPHGALLCVPGQLPGHPERRPRKTAARPGGHRGEVRSGRQGQNGVHRPKHTAVAGSRIGPQGGYSSCAESLQGRGRGAESPLRAAEDGAKGGGPRGEREQRRRGLAVEDAEVGSSGGGEDGGKGRGRLAGPRARPEAAQAHGARGRVQGRRGGGQALRAFREDGRHQDPLLRGRGHARPVPAANAPQEVRQGVLGAGQGDGKRGRRRHHRALPRIA
mmetsp:Transcript_34388/g.83210  ORF Transcript_34388/g.83210 Transcript_34388/m.83210 type:complete len:269 (-) Transcript_34388:1404-2210(-)